MRYPTWARLLRVHQWPKNAFVGAALVFSGAFTSWGKVSVAAAAVLLFCLVSSAVYIFNDICDVAADRRHPTKRLRPIASGRVSPRAAALLGALLALASVGVAALLNPSFAGCLASYALLHLGYSLWLKQLTVVDVLTVAVGFVLRVVAGAIILGVSVTPWLLLATFFLTLSFALGKRLQELRWSDEQEAGDVSTRPTLARYTPDSLRQMLNVSVTAALMTYSLYTFTAHSTPVFMATIPPVVYTLFRFMLLLDRGQAQAATDYFTNDRGLRWGAAAWLALTLAAIALTEIG